MGIGRNESIHPSAGGQTASRGLHGQITRAIDRRVRGDRTEQVRLRTDHRDVSQTVTAQRDRDRQVERDLARVVTGPELEAIRAKVVAKYGVMTKVAKVFNEIGGMIKRKRIPYADRGVVVTPG